MSSTVGALSLVNPCSRSLFKTSPASLSATPRSALEVAANAWYMAFEILSISKAVTVPLRLRISLIVFSICELSIIISPTSVEY